MRERDLFIDGRWRPAHSGRRLAINDPATGERVGSTRARRRRRRRRRRRSGRARAAGLGLDARRRARPHSASRRRSDCRASADHRRAPDPGAGEADPRRGKGNPLRGRSHPLLCRGRAENRREHPGVVARGHSKPRRLLPGRRRRRHHAMELSGRHLRLEAGAGAGGRLHAGRKAAARDAACNRPHRAMLRRRGPSRRRARTTCRGQVRKPARRSPRTRGSAW